METEREMTQILTLLGRASKMIASNVLKNTQQIVEKVGLLG